MPAARPMAEPAGHHPTQVDSLSALVGLLRPGERVYLPGSGGEPLGLMQALSAGGTPLAITASFVPGINPWPLADLPAGTVMTASFAHAGPPEAQAEGRMRHLPLSYAGFAAHLRGSGSFDTTIVHVGPPDAEGACSLGIAVEFTLMAIAASRRVLAVVNPRMPAITGAPSLPLASFAGWALHDAPLRKYDVGTPSAEAGAIAAHVAAFVQDGATIQTGLGKVPDALLRGLTDRRNIKLHSGMLSDGVIALAGAGALDPDWAHTSCVHVGSNAYYQWLAGRRDIGVAGCDHTHDPAVLAALPGLVAVNAALSVDLFGQANLEMLDGRMVSGVGGAADFARAAALAPGGLSIVALPSTAGRSQVSRIVPRLDGVCSLPRQDVEVVVTEHGAADLRGCSVVERAERLVAVAAPAHRARLAAEFTALAGRL